MFMLPLAIPPPPPSPPNRYQIHQLHQPIIRSASSTPSTTSVWTPWGIYPAQGRRPSITNLHVESERRQLWSLCQHTSFINNNLLTFFIWNVCPDWNTNVLHKSLSALGEVFSRCFFKPTFFLFKVSRVNRIFQNNVFQYSLYRIT